MNTPEDAERERLRETLAVLRKASPSSNPTLEDIARLHELHARHEREAGRYERAEAAEGRARRARARADTGLAPPPGEPDNREA